MSHKLFQFTTCYNFFFFNLLSSLVFLTFLCKHNIHRENFLYLKCTISVNCCKMNIPIWPALTQIKQKKKKKTMRGVLWSLTPHSFLVIILTEHKRNVASRRIDYFASFSTVYDWNHTVGMICFCSTLHLEDYAQR